MNIAYNKRWTIIKFGAFHTAWHLKAITEMQSIGEIFQLFSTLHTCLVGRKFCHILLFHTNLSLVLQTFVCIPVSAPEAQKDECWQTPSRSRAEKTISAKIKDIAFSSYKVLLLRQQCTAATEVTIFYTYIYNVFTCDISLPMLAICSWMWQYPLESW